MQRVGPYTLVDEIARGGMGVVYRARDPALDRVVALKLLLVSVPGAEELLRFRREAKASARLRHRGIVAVHGLGIDRGHPYLVMDLVEGQTLWTRLRSGTLDPHEAAELVASLADAVAYAHGRGVLHRDIKPSNVILADDGSPRLTDFGLARIVDADDRLSRTGDVLGTPGYLAPEQAAGRRADVDERTDVYGLGALLFALLCGDAPFLRASVPETLAAVVAEPAPRVSSRRPEVDPALDGICARALATDRAARYQTAAELAAALRGWGRARRPSLPSRRRVSPAWVGAAAFVGWVAGFGGSLAAQGSPPPPAPPVEPAPPPPSPPEPQAKAPAWEGLLLEVERLAERGDHAGAARAAGRAVLLAPGEAHLWRELAWRAFEARDSERARRALDRAQALDPDDIDARRLRIVLVSEPGHTEEQVLDALERLLELAPNDPGGRGHRGMLLVQRGEQTEQALQDLQVALAAGPADEGLEVQLRFHRAGAYEQAGRFEEALADYDAIIALRPKDLPYRAMRAMLWIELGRGGEALAEAEAVLRREPNSALYRRVRGWALVRTGGDLVQAEADYRVAFRFVPTDVKMAVEYLQILRALGRNADALQRVEALLAQWPGTAPLLVIRGELLAEDRPREALDSLEAARDGFPEGPQREQVEARIRALRARLRGFGQ